MSNQKGIASIILIFILIFVGIFLKAWYEDVNRIYCKDQSCTSCYKQIRPQVQVQCPESYLNNSNKNLQTKTEEAIVSQTNIGAPLNEYVNSEAYFSLSYPKDLNLYEVRRSGSLNQNAGYTRGYPSALWLFGRFSDSSRYGQVGICVGKVDFKEDGCTKGGMSLLYGIPELSGKGGSCSEGYKTTNISGQDVPACFWKTGLSVGYPKHPAGLSELTIWADYGEGFSEEMAKKILESIKFIPK